MANAITFEESPKSGVRAEAKRSRGTGLEVSPSSAGSSRFDFRVAMWSRLLFSGARPSFSTAASSMQEAK